MKSLTKTYLINGPNNVVRLQNKDKILYIFGDVHYHPENQYECKYSNTYDSIDIDKLLLRFIKTTDKRVDFFIEQESIDFKLKPYLEYRNNYINQVRKLFQTNEIFINKKKSLCKFHYTDIRNSLISKEFIDFIYDNDDYNIIPYMYEKLDNFTNTVNYIYSNISGLYHDIKKKQNKLINKILGKYKNDNIKKIIKKIFDNIVIKNLIITINNINALRKMILNNKLLLSQNIITLKYINIQYQMMVLYKNIIFLIKRIAMTITDLYFIRRFLDKNYITNSILYTGALHLENILYILVKYFNFEVTNIYYNNNYNFNKIKNKKNINTNFKYLEELSKKLRNIKNNHAVQCINLFDFPDNFE